MPFNKKKVLFGQDVMLCTLLQYLRKSYLKKKTLDPIYHGGLRLIPGTFRTSPAESLYAEANEAPANVRSHKLAL